jgi:hypothetical protein
MAIESFGVLMRAEHSAVRRPPRQVLKSYPHLKLLAEDASEAAYEYFDGECLFEVLCRGKETDREFDVFVRFALCNPDQVERRFLDFIEWARGQWQPRLWMMSSVSKEKVSFSPGELHEFQEAAPTQIRALRAVWQKAFGSKRGAVRVKEVYSWLESGGVSPER